MVLINGLDIKLRDVQYVYFRVHSFSISLDSLVLHCDERVVWSVDCILEYLSLSVQLEGHLMVGRQLLPCLCDLIKVQLQRQQHRTKALSANVLSLSKRHTV